MNIDPQMVNQVLSTIKYPVSKNNLVQMAQQRGANNQVIDVLQRLPDKTFNSPQEIETAFQGLGKQGGQSFNP
jgi:hypothetical protein